MSEQEKNARVVDLNQARKTLASRQTTAKRQGASVQSDSRGFTSGNGVFKKIAMWAQFFFFIILVAWLLRLCR
jgi:hypothetical protein